MSEHVSDPARSLVERHSPRTVRTEKIGSSPQITPQSALLSLQRSAGNRAVAKALQRPTRPSAVTTTVQRQGNPLTSAGPSLASGLVPASFATPAGLPAFRYNLPNIPVASARILTPNAVIGLELLLRGNVQATPSGSFPGVSVDQTGFRVQSDAVVDGLNRGMRISGIGGNEVSIGTTWGTDLETNEVRFTPPNRFAYIGQASLNFMRLTPVGIINFRGQIGFELRATVLPLPQLRPRAIEKGWWERNWGYVAGAALIVGAGLLVAGTIVEDVATGGAGILDDPASFAAAGAMATAGAAAF
jgi:hypothetical protein